MTRRLAVLVCFAFLLASAQQPPAPPGAAFDGDAVVREVNAFYAEHWKAWAERDAGTVAVALAPDFVGRLYLAPQGVVQLDRSAALAGVRQFFQAVGDRQVFWGHSLLAVIPRSPTEAVAAVRNDFSLRSSGEIELTLDVVRKGEDGRWVIVRRWSEKSPF